MKKFGWSLAVAAALLAPSVWAGDLYAAVGLDVPSTSVRLEVVARDRQMAYLSGDPFYLELGVGYKFYFWGDALGGQRLAGFVRAEGVYSFSERSFDASHLALGVEASPDGRLVGGAELLLRPLTWSEQIPYLSGWRYIMLVVPRIVAEYRIPLNW